MLNELDWWLASQWEEIPTEYPFNLNPNPNGSPKRGNKYAALRDRSGLKVVTCVRYADDFKIFTNNYQSAVKLFHATQDWLKDRLGLDISPEKSKIINLREEYSEFLGFKFKVVKRGKRTEGRQKGEPQYVIRSHVKDKAIDKIRTKLDKLIYDMEFPTQGKHSQYNAISNYNSAVIGIHEYYRMATMVSSDFRPLAYSVQKSLKARLQKRFKTAKAVRKKRIPIHISDVIKERYGKSDQLRYVTGVALAPIGFVRHKYPMQRKFGVNSYTPKGRAYIHKRLEKVDMRVLHYLMRNPIPYRSIEYNDNRLSLYSAQMGKCAVTGKVLIIGDIHCHHKIPRHLGGTDKYHNLIIVSEDVHRLIHASNPDTIAKYKERLHLTAKQYKTLSNLVGLVQCDKTLD